MNAAMDAADPLALGGLPADAGDALILDLFHQWQAAMKDANDSPDSRRCAGDVEEKNFEEKMEPVLEIEHRLSRTGASGPVGLAIKGFMAAFNDRGANDEVHGFLLGILEDAVRFVPELGPLAETILAASTGDDEKEEAAPLDIAALRERVAAIVAEFDLPLPDGDAGIFEAARRKRDLDARFRALSHEFEIYVVVDDTEINPERERLEGLLLDHLEKHAKPQTLAAAATLLRHGFENGMQIDPDDGMVGNVLALIEREAGSGGLA